ncbi:hypothetical protein C2845_PM14G13080 [Panicum miliaceum]|uniref:Glucan endo-1,3-beta-D-glucosidase n=1 Tax=Panicum miliaceum TaxID=4540 RepID=A0A3L6PMU3_PANMI|nr:hypothetical protein C2845_PM14G13080 [Panicum miliaceum]
MVCPGSALAMVPGSGRLPAVVPEGAGCRRKSRVCLRAGDGDVLGHRLPPTLSSPVYFPGKNLDLVGRTTATAFVKEGKTLALPQEQWQRDMYKARTVSATASPATTCPRAREVVQLYKSHNIHAMHIFRPDQDTLAALPGSGIGLILGVGGVGAVRSFANSRAAAIVWVHDNVRAYYPDVLIRYIAVGNEVPAGNAGLVVLPAMRNVHAALVAAGLSSSIKVSTAVRMDVIANS